MIGRRAKRASGGQTAHQLTLFESPADLMPAQPAIIAGPAALDGAITEYLVHLARIGKARHTLAATRGDLEQLAASVGVATVDEISTADLHTYVDRQTEERSNGPATLRRKIATIKAFFRYLLREQLRSDDPSATLPYPPALEREVDPLDEIEVERLLEQAASGAHRALLLCMLDAGVKREELLALRADDLTFQREGPGYLTVQRGLAAKRVRTRTVPLTSRLAATLVQHTAALGPDDSLFPLSTRGVDYIVREAGERAGLLRAGSLTPQRLRDTCAVQWMRQRVLRELAEPDADARRRLEAEHDRELAELLGLAPESLSVERYRRAARRQLNRSEAVVLADR